MSLRTFIRQSGTLLSGNVVAQGIAFLAYFLLLRLFTPDDFGLYTVFFSYIEVLIILSTGKYELAIVVADNDQEASQLTRLTLRLNTIVSVLLLLVAVAVARFAPPAAFAGHAYLLLLIPVMVFFCGTTRVFTFLFNRYQHYRAIAASEVVTSVCGVVVKVALGLASAFVPIFHAIGMPIGTVVGKIAGNGYYRAMIRRTIPAALRRDDKERGGGKVLVKFRNFPQYVMPKELVSSLSANLPFIWLSLYFDNALIGLFSLAFTFTMRPTNVLNCAFERVLYASVSVKVREGQPIGREIFRFVLLLNAVAIPLLVLAFFVAEPFMAFCFGSKWVGTGYYMRCLIPWVWVLLTANSLMFVSNVFGTQRVDFAMLLLLLGLRVVALWVGIRMDSYHMAILLFSAASTLVVLLLAAWYLYQVHRYDAQLSTNRPNNQE